MVKWEDKLKVIWVELWSEIVGVVFYEVWGLIVNKIWKVFGGERNFRNILYGYINFLFDIIIENINNL